MAEAMSEPTERQRTVLDYYFGAGAADSGRWRAEWNIRWEANERKLAIAEGRRHEGAAHTWYASITWSRNAWYGLHGERGPRR